MGYNAHFANVLSAIFLATGQDPRTSSAAPPGVTCIEPRENGAVYASIFIPDAPLGAIGGGTSLNTQSEALRILGVVPDPDRPGHAAMRLAEIVGAAVLAGELSLMAAFTSSDLARAHERLGAAGLGRRKGSMSGEATVSAPGKTILFGEHAAVYGHPALVTALDHRLTAIARRSASSGPRPVHLEIPDMGIATTAAATRELRDVRAGRSRDARAAIATRSSASRRRDFTCASNPPFRRAPVREQRRARGGRRRRLPARLRRRRHPTRSGVWRCRSERHQHGRASGVDVQAVLRGGSALVPPARTMEPCRVRDLAATARSTRSASSIPGRHTKRPARWSTSVRDLQDRDPVLRPRRVRDDRRRTLAPGRRLSSAATTAALVPIVRAREAALEIPRRGSRGRSRIDSRDRRRPEAPPRSRAPAAERRRRGPGDRRAPRPGVARALHAARPLDGARRAFGRGRACASEVAA
jgi:hypothetical protein